MVVWCKNPVRTQPMTHTKSATVCSCHRPRKRPRVNPKLQSSCCRAFEENFNHFHKRSVPASFSSHKLVQFHIHKHHDSHEILKIVSSLSGLIFGLVFYSFVSLPVIFFFSPGSHPAHSYYRTAMCLCQRQSQRNLTHKHRESHRGKLEKKSKTDALQVNLKHPDRAEMWSALLAC